MNKTATTGRLAGKRALVTGGANGIGRGIVLGFVREGAEVLFTDIDEEAGLKLAQQKAINFRVQDVASEASWREIANETERLFDGLDILVNNAGIGDASRGNSPEDTELEDWRRFFQVNVESVFLGCKSLLPLMARGGGGSIINMSSIAALVPTPFLSAYGSSKAAVLQFSKSVALHCAQTGSKIRCNTIHPGQITTPMHDRLVQDTAKTAGVSVIEARADFQSRIPIGEFGSVEDIANMAIFLASDEARHITGAQMLVDGGMKLTN